ncbi:P-loop containing nucleoside triphosphate hydrolase [Hyaloscypha variabilis]
MSLPGLLSTPESELPSTIRIHDVMNACHCSEGDAMRLLKQCSNNVEEAKLRHDIEKLYGLPTAPTETQIHQPTHEYDFDFLSDESSDDDLTLITPSPGEDPPSRKKALAKPPPPPKKPKKLRAVSLPKNESDNTQHSPTIHQPEEEAPHPMQDRTSAPDPETASHSASEPKLWPEMEPEAEERVAPTETTSEASDIRNDTLPGSASRAPFITSSPVPKLPVEESIFPQRVLEDLVIEDPVHNAPQPENIMVDDVKEPEWNFILPEIPPPPSLTPGVGEGNDGFNLRDLVGAIQHGIDVRFVTEYLAYYDSDFIRTQISDTVEGFPSIFFAVGTNNETLIRMWIEHGADVSAVHSTSKAPLLAFAIMNSEQLDTDTTLTVSTLLSLGAAPQVIPSSFYTPFIQDLPNNGPSDEILKDDLEDETYSWCTPAARAKLARTANITQRYYLERASKTKKPSSRHKQVAKLRNAKALLGIPYFLIGQTMAANRLYQKLLNYMMVPTKRPLVMVFAGPSGHGKTELARRLGHLMSLDLEIVDCTIYSREIELFGPRDPYVGAEHGSPLNNFLAKNAGKRCIVFLDEFEKTTTDIHQALLVPFDNGEYQDRRDLKQIDCSKTVWILATNALDSTIQSFCKVHHKSIFEDDDVSEKLRLMKSLSKAIKEDFLAKFGSPVTGRISDFLPFLPFSPGEQAVIVHKFLLELGQKVQGPVNLVPGPKEQLLGNVKLKIRKDASVCRILAEAEYHSDLGARSLIMGARRVEDILVEAYLEVDEEIRESEKMVDFVVDVNGSEIIAKMVKQKESEEIDIT